MLVADIVRDILRAKGDIGHAAADRDAAARLDPKFGAK
jgi:hypothetical protein